MEDFYIDKGGHEDDETYVNFASTEEDEVEEIVTSENFIRLDELPSLSENSKKGKNVRKKEFGLNNTYLITNYTENKEKKLFNIDGVSDKFRILLGLEKKPAIKPIKSLRLLKKERKKCKEQTKGNNWFNMQAMEITPEIKSDLEILKMRAVLDKKHVYKKNDITALPKYFQVGTVVENATDFYSGRIVKSERKKTIVEELLADAECKRYQKEKYKEILDSKRKKFHKKHNKKRTNGKG